VTQKNTEPNQPKQIVVYESRKASYFSGDPLPLAGKAPHFEAFL
jgi:hypothetical protein